MKMIKYLILCIVTIFALSNIQVTAQCTEAKDVEMAKYMKLTKTQDAQGCSLDPANVKKVKHYMLSCQPYDFYFTKENGDCVINFQALNDFRFPITKKYSLGKLSTMEIKNISSQNDKENISTQSSNNEKLSVADEIKKLKVLLDSGTITKEEFNAAKKQLLNNK